MFDSFSYLKYQNRWKRSNVLTTMLMTSAKFGS